jgi:redox-sensitive bicupin YhaK (pirin superfamily)
MDAVLGLADVITLPAPGPGFIGEGHTAIHVMQGREFARTDPFIMLADDRLDLPPGTRAGGPHPHAGFEIVTFAVEGEARDRDEGLLRAGDVLWMTAGSGVVHNEDVEPLGKLRILQLWTTLPSGSRWAPPRFALGAAAVRAYAARNGACPSRARDRRARLQRHVRNGPRPFAHVPPLDAGGRSTGA